MKAHRILLPKYLYFRHIGAHEAYIPLKGDAKLLIFRGLCKYFCNYFGKNGYFRVLPQYGIENFHMATST